MTCVISLVFSLSRAAISESFRTGLVLEAYARNWRNLFTAQHIHHNIQAGPTTCNKRCARSTQRDLELKVTQAVSLQAHKYPGVRLTLHVVIHVSLDRFQLLLSNLTVSPSKLEQQQIADSVAFFDAAIRVCTSSASGIRRQ